MFMTVVKIIAINIPSPDTKIGDPFAMYPIPAQKQNMLRKIHDAKKKCSIGFLITKIAICNISFLTYSFFSILLNYSYFDG